MSDNSHPPVTVSASDLTAVRWLALAWGVVIAGSWLITDELHMQLLMTGVQLAILGASLLALYLLRRWRSRRRPPTTTQPR